MKLSRSDFLKNLSLLTFAGIGFRNTRHSTLTDSPDPHYSPYDPVIEIYPDNMRNNVREIARVVDGQPIMAVIKNNGYGMGVVESARILEPMNEISDLAVVKLSEAMQLRQAGIQKPILLLALCEGEQLELAIRHDITPMVYTPVGDQLEQLSRKYNKTIPVEVKLDTGLGRLGVRAEDAPEFYRDLSVREGIRIQGSFITFTESRDFDEIQIRRFRDLTDRLRDQGTDPGRRHAASTTPIFRHPDAYFDMVRPGIGLYGIYPQPETQRKQNLMDLKPAFGLKCRVVLVKKLNKGETAGYGQAFKAEQDTWLATLPVGHADGWQRSAAGCARVRIKGNLYPVVASVSASHTLVDLGSETEIKTGDEAVIFDAEEGSRPDDITASCGTSAYDLSMHLSPSLPRKVMR